jgi:hypothetical protein
MSTSTSTSASTWRVARALGAALAVAVVGVGPMAWAGISKLRGQIIVSDDPLPMNLEDEDKLANALAKANKTTLERSKGSDTWSFHIMAFPDRKPGATSLELMFYDVTDGKRTYVTSKEISVSDAAAQMIAADIDVSEEDGIKPGRKIELDMAKMVGDKETNLAKAKVLFTVAK